MSHQGMSGSEAHQPAYHDQLRRRWIKHWREWDIYGQAAESLRDELDECCDRIRANWRRADISLFEQLQSQLNALTPPRFPDELRGYTCGAKTRAGTPCKQGGVFSNGRCKFHGGASTGPVTEAGKAQARENGKLGGRPPKKPKPM